MAAREFGLLRQGYYCVEEYGQLLLHYARRPPTEYELAENFLPHLDPAVNTSPTDRGFDAKLCSFDKLMVAASKKNQ